MERHIQDLVPFGFGYPANPWMVEENPLTALARVNPYDASSLISKQIDLNKIQTRIDGLRSVSQSHTEIACDWLQNRHQGEQNMVIASAGDSSERGLFPRGETVRMVTKISIW